MVEPAWANARHAFNACAEQDMPKSASEPVFASLKNYQVYEECKDDSNIYGVRLVGADGGLVPIAALDFLTHSLWFRAYLRNRYALFPTLATIF